jgi:adenylosuccinate lyase
MSLEAKLRHDVKAIEYFIKDIPEIAATGKAHLVHIGLTSQDICSLGFISCIYKSSLFIQERLEALLNVFKTQLIECPQSNTYMLGFTHGQPATPTSFQKEMKIYQTRIERILDELKTFNTNKSLTVKFGGATGEMNALKFAMPEINWVNWCNQFINEISHNKFQRSEFTNQCDDYDSVCKLLYIYKRMLHILEHLRGNLWLYIHKAYLVQKAISSEIGSSTMPNKVNPIDLENAKTAIELAKRMIDGICDILNETALQRDVSDSSALRNISSVFGYILVAIAKLSNGISRLSPNVDIMKQELEEHPEVILEGIQTYLKLRCNMGDAYEKMKDISRGRLKITLDDIHKTIDNLEIPNDDKDNLKQLTPSNFMGFY